MSEVPLHQHWHDVYVRRWLILLTTAAAVVVALAFSRAVTPIFEAKTTFYLAATAPTPSFVGPTEAPAPLYPVPEEKAAALDIGILRGREVRTALAERFDLPYSEIEQRVDYNVSGEFMIDVFARNPDPELAAAISNAVPEIYEEFHERSMRARAGNIARVLEQRLEDLEAREEEVRAALRALREESLSTADSAALARIEAEREAAQTEMHALETQIAQTTARLGSLEASLSDEDLIYAEARTVDTTSSLDRMLERVLDLRVDLAAVTDGPNSPRRLAIEQQISQIEDAMAREQERLAEASAKPQGTLYEELRMEIATTEALLAGLAQARDSAASRLARAESRFAEVLGASDAHSEAMAELERIEAQTAATIENLEAARLQEANATPPLLVVERAVPPTRPAFPLSVLNAIAAALCGLVFGTYYALFIAQSERAAQVRRSRTAPMPAFTPQEIAEIRVLAREWERANAR